ncbi:hypothetical protein HMPREF9098_2024 [Kingella denitrificans ATCC 33394]|uniref:Uncharacterized protein n=1 Tax=Kingella denitrificans ATCC 33394 TaxID=888741 RepID=F0F1N9_9NEIS|nr:hypothetical protein HMPREF9098_2024 [Kingella denitrificans ATCC 33394]
MVKCAGCFLPNLAALPKQPALRVALRSKIMNICNDLDIFCQYSRLSLNSRRAFR